MHPKHQPQRQCVVCGVRAPQRELVRIALGPDGQLTVGIPGKRSGRGAYLCHKGACWKGVLKGDRLSQTLKVALDTRGRELIAAYGNSIQQNDSLEPASLARKKAT